MTHRQKIADLGVDEGGYYSVPAGMIRVEIARRRTT